VNNSVNNYGIKLANPETKMHLCGFWLAKHWGEFIYYGNI